MRCFQIFPKEAFIMERTLKDSFVNLIEYVTYRQEKDRKF